MAVQRQTPPAPAVPGAVDERPSTSSRARLLGGGTSGNERLTSIAGAVLLVLLAVLGVTIIRIGQLLWIHMFVGMLLIGPLALKMASTGYRFLRYYTHDAPYVRKGPPPIALRLLAPLVVASTIVVFASGVALLFAGPSSRDTLFPIHKLSFFAWLALTGVHVLAHLPEVGRSLSAEYRSRADVGVLRLSGGVNGRVGRSLSLAGAIVLGAVLAILVIPEFAPWLSSHR
ncbi:MAG: hypothetical protein QOF54_1254 [Solirubrobacteraceae bacterium]|nr:hypothetical protein [Solirubrobacteraceae bacterium]